MQRFFKCLSYAGVGALLYSPIGMELLGFTIHKDSVFSLIGFLLVIGIVVTIHEYGHFLAARLCGVGVLKFAVGFGPALFKKTHKGTDYILAAIPLGGYVRMVGDMPDMITGPQATDEEVRMEGEGELPDVEDVSPEVKAMLEDKSQWFIHKSYLQKSIIVFAGPLANFLLAILLAITFTFFYGIKKIDETKIGAVYVGSPADQGGLLEGDRILSIAGSEINTFEDIENSIKNSEGNPLEFMISRDGVSKVFTIAPKIRKTGSDDAQKKYMVGISPGVKSIPAGFFESIPVGIERVYNGCVLTIHGVYGVIAGKVSSDSIGGPIMIYQVSGKALENGIESFVNLLIVINLTLGLLNLMPIPLLDGGHLLTFLVESIFGPMNTKVKETAQVLGFGLLISLMVFAFKNDLSRDPSEVREPKKPDWESIEEEMQKQAVGQE